MQVLRSRGTLCVNYLDDFLILGETFSDCMYKTNFAVQLLESLGFLINRGKSVLNPSKVCKFLGFIFHTDTLKLELPIEKRNRIIK